MLHRCPEAGSVIWKQGNQVQQVVVGLLFYLCVKITEIHRGACKVRVHDEREKGVAGVRLSGLSQDPLSSDPAVFPDHYR